MKRLFLLVAVGLMAAGCAASKADIPDCDVYVPLSNGMVVRIPKGHLNPENKDKYWKDEEGYRQWLEQQHQRKGFKSPSFSSG